METPSPQPPQAETQQKPPLRETVVNKAKTIVDVVGQGALGFASKFRKPTLSDHEDATKFVTDPRFDVLGPFEKFNIGLHPGESGPELEQSNWPFPATEKLNREMEDIITKYVESGNETQQIQSYYLNRDDEYLANGGEAMVIFHGVGSSSKADLTPLTAKRLATAFKMPVVSFVENPPYGKTKGLTETQKQDVHENKSLREIVKTELAAAQQMGVKNMRLLGISMGGAMAVEAAEIASEMGIELSGITVVDPPGFIKQTVPEMFTNFTREGTQKYGDMYASAPYDPEIRQTVGMDRSEAYRMARSAAWVAKNVARDPSFKVARTMNEPTIIEKLKDVRSKFPALNMVLIRNTNSGISGYTKEGVTHEEKVDSEKAIAEDLRSIPDLRYIVSPGGTHNALTNNPNRTAGLIWELAGPADKLRTPLPLASVNQSQT